MTKVGKYELVRKLATGGMAEVFLAKFEWASGLYKTVVVKRILPVLANEPNLLDMFLSEARLASQLNHPNIAQIIEFGDSHGTKFLAMEYVDGPSLRKLSHTFRKRGEPIPFAHCARIVAFACEALAHAHELRHAETGQPLGLVHRDVSPDNILISKTGAVKLVDFGVAKAAIQAHHTKTGTIKGKLAYMAPEQLRGDPVDRRADVYSLGVVLYELIAGARPYSQTNEAQLMHAIMYEDRIPLLSRRPDTPKELDRIVTRAMARERGLRYPDCRVMHAELEQFMISARRPVSVFQIAELVQRAFPEEYSAPTPEPTSQEASTDAAPVLPPPPPKLVTPAKATPQDAETEVAVEALEPATSDKTPVVPPPINLAPKHRSGGHLLEGPPPERAPTPPTRTSRTRAIVLGAAALALALGAAVLVPRLRPLVLPSDAPAAEPEEVTVPPLSELPSTPPLDPRVEQTQRLLAQARLLTEARDHSAAARLLLRCLEIDPTNAECHLALASAHERAPETRAFLKVGAAPAARDKRSVPAAKLQADGGSSPGQGAADGGADIAPEDPIDPERIELARQLREKGEAQLKAGDYEGARKDFAQCLVLNPFDAECHLGLGSTFAALGNRVKSTQQYLEFLRLDPKHKRAGEVRELLKDYERQQSKPK